jgi:hypothetical protein
VPSQLGDSVEVTLPDALNLAETLKTGVCPQALFAFQVCAIRSALRQSFLIGGRKLAVQSEKFWSVTYYLLLTILGTRQSTAADKTCTTASEISTTRP